ncbi:MAG: carboxypeptidase-like regulatory domain-containing protein [Gemmatimonadaceae bacterium]
MPQLLRLSCVALTSALVAFSWAGAQANATRVSVRGIAYDALHDQPLRNALITLGGDPRNTTTDSRGRFQFDSVAPGVHTFAMHHAVIDALGFTGLSTRAVVTDGHDEIRIAVPSFAFLWRAACGDRAVPSDSGLVYGTIRDATGMHPARGATVDVSWAAVIMTSTRKIIERRWHTTAISDSTGSYSVCGVAPDEMLEVRATIGSSESSWIALPRNASRVQRRDLIVGPATTTDSVRRGTVMGRITDSFGLGFQEARVRVDGVPEIRSDSDGRFTLANVPAGTRNVEVSMVGMVPVIATVDVITKDTAVVALQFGPALMLDGVKVVAARSGHVLAAEFDSRRRTAAGFTMDSIQIAQFPKLYDALKMAPSTNAQYLGGVLHITMPRIRGGTCEPAVRIDGQIAGLGHLLDLQPEEVAAFEVYARPLFVPSLYLTGENVPACGMILVWTKYAFRNR